MPQKYKNGATVLRLRLVFKKHDQYLKYRDYSILKLTEFFEATFYFLHLLRMAAALPEAEHQSHREGK